MQRTLEAEIMGDAQQALAYARADFSQSNQWYVDHLVAGFPESLRNVVDIGCGPGDIAVRLAKAHPAVHITAVDGSEEMITLARQAVRAAGLESRIATVLGYVPGVALADGGFSGVLSKDLLHHLPDPLVLWREARRLAEPGAGICVMDLIRPDTPDAARRIVEASAAGEHPMLKADFFNSLCAAFTLDEVRGQLAAASLPLTVARVSERHMLIEGRLPQSEGAQAGLAFSTPSCTSRPVKS